MKSALIALAALCAASAMAQSHYREGYVRKDGTYVPPSYATNPNDTKLDNYSTKGNVNPYSGRTGTVDPYKVEQPQAQSIYQRPDWQKQR